MTFASVDTALTGPLFATARMRAIFSDEAQIATMLEAETALATAQAAIGLAPPALADRLRQLKSNDFDLVELGAQTALAGVPVIPFVKAVQARLPTELEPFFHQGSTTQDIVDTALVLRATKGLDELRSDLQGCLRGLLHLTEAHRATPCVGRTYGQHASPITFGAKVGVWASGITDVAARLNETRRRIAIASLDGPVGTFAAMGDKAEEVRRHFAEALGLDVFPTAWHAVRTRIAETGFWLAELIGSLAKMARDIGLLCSTEVGEVAEPFVKGRGGSSSMPHKRNPVSCTIILAAHAAAPGHVSTLLNAMAVDHERPIGLWHGEWHALPQLFALASGALHEARNLSEGLVVNAERMRANIDATAGMLFSDSLAEHLAQALGRGAAHAIVERAAQITRTSGRHLKDVGIDIAEVSSAELQQVWRAAFDLTPAITAGVAVADRAVALIAAALSHISESEL
ncbi:class-II fumarase/aspartase family protein [Methylovirgula sp. 4M-Z18]|uniref:class-II fumarase/aspartase family protein n=1 Tax=Methylovirgula sp. 4M-Z18 TaxID=2293567 RepID=UPI000E2F84BC|nr:adenylosuccinate lyase family protein [Methylovirgula sp. 4M-Z18]RFB79452.1 adenylosuccinate lyase family protein [Methylovirgula sp. 4M-Z18]